MSAFIPQNHPIQLMKVDIKELFFKSNESSDPNYEFPEDHIRVGIGCSEPSEQDFFSIGIKISLGSEEDQSNKYFAKIELIGHFYIDTENFKLEHLPSWTKNNAPIVLLPFIREHLYSITLRAGFKPFILPLIQVPQGA